MGMEQLDVHKVTLSSGKVVYLKDMEIGIEEQAAKLAASKAGDNATLLSFYMQQELPKLLIMKIDDKILTPQDKELLKKHLTYRETKEVMKAIAMVMGGEIQDPKLEIVSGGQLSPG